MFYNLKIIFKDEIGISPTDSAVAHAAREQNLKSGGEYRQKLTDFIDRKQNGDMVHYIGSEQAKPYIQICCTEDFMRELLVAGLLSDKRRGEFKVVKDKAGPEEECPAVPLSGRALALTG